MKTTKKPSINKLVARFDSELKMILLQDLKAVKNKQVQLPNAA